MQELLADREFCLEAISKNGQVAQKLSSHAEAMAEAVLKHGAEAGLRVRGPGDQSRPGGLRCTGVHAHSRQKQEEDLRDVHPHPHAMVLMPQSHVLRSLEPLWVRTAPEIMGD